MKKALIILAGIIFLGCEGKPDGAQTAAPQSPPVPVTTFTARASDLPIVLEYPAKLVSSGFVEVRAKVGGTLLSREYKEGGAVSKGAPLFLIDPAKYRAAKDAAQAAFNQTEREYRRAEKLIASNAVSEKDRDTALGAYESAKAALDNAALDLGYTRVIAPIDGFAGAKALDAGNFITAGTLLTTITKTNPLHAEFSFTNIERLKAEYVIAGGDWTNPIGIKVAVKGENGEEYPNEGKIDFVDASIDMNTGSVKARAVLPNSKGELMAGQFVRVALSGVTKKNAFRIPSEALMQTPEGKLVYVVEDGKASHRFVTIEGESDRFIILSDGIRDGDEIIMDNLLKLRPGSPVATRPSQTQQDQGR
ncbi:MAG: efflux RND transporter periplasmic adaptor subunit [Helicobacteraceae bacterium]|jgi:membrane fusion protein (multidrug efflux system)|nr:efflux RND transporter periplasmic adaptor subunit [Helicobacteraceae bacterium]